VPDLHPYWTLYLLGCAFVPPLLAVRALLFYALRWITKGNILEANLKKLNPPEKKAAEGRLLKFVWNLVLEAAFSWINVLVLVWSTLALLLRTTRDAFSAAPESIQQLRFPLKSNPDLAREAVWAYAIALGIRNGETSDSARLTSVLETDAARLWYFDADKALAHLETLEVVKPAVLAEVKRVVDSEESVWARKTALGIRNGETQDPARIFLSLVRDPRLPRLSQRAALARLEALEVVELSVLTQVEEMLSDSEGPGPNTGEGEGDESA
jgi:hypothetical protein